MKKLLTIILVTVFTVLTSIPSGHASGEIHVGMKHEDAAKLEGPFLIIMTVGSVGSSTFFRYHKMSDMAQCYETIRNSKIQIPRGGDAEIVVGLYCAPNLAKYLKSEE